MTTKTQKILEFLHKEGTSRVSEIGRALKEKQGTVQTYLQGMKKRELVKRTGYGKYRATPDGIKYLGIPVHTVSVSVRNEPRSDRVSVDLDDMETIAQLKHKYGDNFNTIIEKVG